MHAFFPSARSAFKNKKERVWPARLEGVKLILIMAEPRYEPDPRSYSSSAAIDGELCVWGGKGEATTSVQVYDSCLEVWKEVLTHGSPPPALFQGASAHSEHYLYVYGGVLKDNSLSGCLHRLDTKTSSWAQLAAYSANAPMKKYGSEMIVYKNSVIIIGGWGTRNGPIQPGSEWVCKDEDEYEDPNTEGRTNEMHKYDLREGEIELSYIKIYLTGNVSASNYLRRMNSK